jgi:hypothetical protein
VKEKKNAKREFNQELRTQNCPRLGRSCGQCDCAARVVGGRPDEWVCANHPEHAGRLAMVVRDGGSVDDVASRCRSFRFRREGTETGTPTLSDEVRHISLAGGLFAIVDAADYEWLSKYHWRAVGPSPGYACCTIKGKVVFMHRLIMDPPPGKVIDHVNGNKQDNRRRNLRECTQAENLRNSRKGRGTSRFKGVCWYRRFERWAAKIYHDGKTILLGWFDDEVEAARAYDRAALRFFGQFACLNFPEGTNVVWLSGRLDVRSHVRGRNAEGVALRIVNCGLRSCYRRRAQSAIPNPQSAMRRPPVRGVRSRRGDLSRFMPDVSTPLRFAQHDKEAQPDKGGRVINGGRAARRPLNSFESAIYNSQSAMRRPASRGPPEGWGKCALKASGGRA